MRLHLGRRVRGLIGATTVGLVLSANVAATDCVVHSKVCQTLVIQASGPLRAYVQVLGCISGAGLTWDVRVTDGSHVVHVPMGDSPSLVPGRTVAVPAAGRWWLDVRMSNADQAARCMRGESTTDPVTVPGIAATPRPTPHPTPRPAPVPQPASSPALVPSPFAARSPAFSASTSSSPESSASVGSAIGLSGSVPPFGGGDVSPEGAGGSGEGSPLLVLALFGIGLGGVELIAYAIRRELRMRRRSATPGSGHEAAR